MIDTDDGPIQKHGVILAEDDLEVGQHYCVYNMKQKPNHPTPIMGQSFEIKAVCLPYVVAKLLADPSEPILTLDCRFLNLMRVTPEYVQIQREGAKHNNRPPQPQEG
jgi:hypothetical protein